MTHHSPANPSNRPRLRPDSWRRARLGPSGAPPAPRPLAANVEGELKGKRKPQRPVPVAPPGSTVLGMVTSGGYFGKISAFRCAQGPRCAPQEGASRGFRPAPAQGGKRSTRAHPRSWCIRTPVAQHLGVYAPPPPRIHQTPLCRGLLALTPATPAPWSAREGHAPLGPLPPPAGVGRGPPLAPSPWCTPQTWGVTQGEMLRKSLLWVTPWGPRPPSLPRPFLAPPPV